MFTGGLEGSDTPDETLTVTTEVVEEFDPEIYKSMIGLGILAITLVINAWVRALYDMIDYVQNVLHYRQKHVRSYQMYN